jgi:hypothetical protein
MGAASAFAAAEFVAMETGLSYGTAAALMSSGFAGWVLPEALITTASVVGGIAGGASAAIVGDAVRGTSFSQAMKDGLIGGVVGGISAGVLHNMEGNWAEHTVGHALLGGAAQKAEGGKFWAGFAASGISSGLGSSWISSVDGNDPLVHTLIAAGLGGTISKLTGGSFYSGALNSAVEWAYNEERGKWGAFWHAILDQISNHGVIQISGAVGLIYGFEGSITWNISKGTVDFVGGAGFGVNGAAIGGGVGLQYQQDDPNYPEAESGKWAADPPQITAFASGGDGWGGAVTGSVSADDYNALSGTAELGFHLGTAAGVVLEKGATYKFGSIHESASHD